MHAEIKACHFLHRCSWFCSAVEAMIGAEGVWGCGFIMLKQRAGPGLNRMERTRRRWISRWGSCQRVKIKDTSEAETNCFFDNTLLHSIMHIAYPVAWDPHTHACAPAHTCWTQNDAIFRAGYLSMPFCMSVAGMFLQPYILVCIWGPDWGSHSGWFTRARSSGSNSVWRTWGCTDSMWREAEDCVKGRMKESIWKGHRKDEQASNNGLRWCKTSVKALLYRVTFLKIFFTFFVQFFLLGIKIENLIQISLVLSLQLNLFHFLVDLPPIHPCPLVSPPSTCLLEWSTEKKQVKRGSWEAERRCAVRCPMGWTWSFVMRLKA